MTTRDLIGTVSIDFTRRDWPLSRRQMREARGELERRAEGLSAQLLRGSKRIVDKGKIVTLEFDMVPIGRR